MSDWQGAVCRLYHGHPARGGSARGTACFVAPDRLLTAAHLVRDIPAEGVYLGGLPRDAVERVLEVRCHAALDLAWLRIGAPQPLRPLRIDARPLPELATLTLCGFPDPSSGLRTSRHALIARDGGFQLGIVQGYPGTGISGGAALLGAAGVGRDGRSGWPAVLAALAARRPPRLVAICSARHRDRNEGLILPLAAAPELLAELRTGAAAAGPDRRRALGMAALGLGLVLPLALALLFAATGTDRRPLGPSADDPPTAQPLTGSVRDAAGEPLAGISVTLAEYDLTATTDPLGRFRFKVPAPAGTLVELLASSPTHRTHRDYAAVGTTGLGIVMERRAP